MNREIKIPAGPRPANQSPTRYDVLMMSSCFHFVYLSGQGFLFSCASALCYVSLLTVLYCW
jgi:hypothetical protein